MTSTPPPQSAGGRREGPPAARPRSRTSVGQVFAAVAGFVALAAIGAAIGWGVTDAPDKLASGGPSTPASTPASSTPPSPPSPPPSSPSPTGVGFQLPDYAATATPFQQAREQLIANKIQVVLIFADTGDVGTTVTKTDPPAGTFVPHGRTVKVTVNGTPPPLAVPALPQVPTKCADWGSFLVRTGFNIQYEPRNGKNLQLAGESPDENTPGTVWNQTITLTCTADGNMPPSSSPASPPDSGSPSPSS